MTTTKATKPKKRSFSSFSYKEACQQVGITRLETWEVAFEPVAPSDFFRQHLERLKCFDLGSSEESKKLMIDAVFVEVHPMPPSERLTSTLQDYLPLAIAINSEKARSEFIIAPVLAEVRQLSQGKVSLFSGKEFDVDKARGLSGFCDFILSCSSEQLYITAPVVEITEAKNENIIGGLGQCIAGMVAAQIFNQRQENPMYTIYGAVTSGTNWRFLTLKEQIVCIDAIEYYIKEIDKILGILMQPIQDYLQLDDR
jgi:hypothetical protein